MSVTLNGVVTLLFSQMTGLIELFSFFSKQEIVISAKLNSVTTLCILLFQTKIAILILVCVCDYLVALVIIFF